MSVDFDGYAVMHM